MMAVGESAETIQIMKVARRSPMHNLDVAGKSAVYYSHHDDEQFIAKHLYYTKC
jgi:hypothetical protein